MTLCWNHWIWWAIDAFPYISLLCSITIFALSHNVFMYVFISTITLYNSVLSILKPCLLWSHAVFMIYLPNTQILVKSKALWFQATYTCPKISFYHTTTTPKIPLITTAVLQAPKSPLITPKLLPAPKSPLIFTTLLPAQKFLLIIPPLLPGLKSPLIYSITLTIANIPLITEALQ